EATDSTAQLPLTRTSVASAATRKRPGQPAPSKSEEHQTCLLRRPNQSGQINSSASGPSEQPARLPSPPQESVARPAEVHEYVPPPPPPERPETTGNGVLMPALVVGLGGLGKEVLAELRKALRKRGPNESWPHIRLLNIDTDPEGYDRAMNEPD